MGFPFFHYIVAKPAPQTERQSHSLPRSVAHPRSRFSNLTDTGDVVDVRQEE